MIIVSITGPSMQEALQQVASSSKYADMFEFRLDLMGRPNIAQLLSSTHRPTIATCRPEWQGGKFTGSERERIGMLDFAAVFGATYVDIELGVAPSILKEFIRRKKETPVIVSHHRIDGPPSDVARIYRDLHSTGADVIKMAYVASDGYELHHAIDFLARATSDKRKAVAIAMGEFGEPSRILYKKFGGWATYASSEDGKSAAPGQLPASQLRDPYRADRLDRKTKIFGVVVGAPMRQSKGTHVHNPLFRRAKTNAVYCRFPVMDLKKFMNFVVPHVGGLSVTIPHKETIMRYLDQIDPVAKGIGAVNTVVRRGKKLIGSNTDAPAALDAIEKVMPVKGKRVFIIGAGGAARAIAYEAKQRGAEVLITNRSLSRAIQLAKEFGLEVVKMANVRQVKFDILVNATPIGMAPDIDESPVPKTILRNKVVFDVVFNPPMTKLLRDARSVGAQIVQGTEMYIGQAAAQSLLYAGVKPSKAFMRKILKMLDA